MLHVHLKKFAYISVKSSWLTLLLSPSKSLLIFHLAVLPIIQNRLLNSQIIAIEFPLFSSVLCVCFVYYNTLLLGMYTFIIVISSWCITFLSSKCPFLSIIIFLILISIVSNRAIPPFLRLLFAFFSVSFCF